MFFTLLFCLGVAVVAVEAMTELLVKSKIFAGFRDLLPRIPNARLANFLTQLFSCGYCTSVWVAFGPAILFSAAKNTPLEYITSIAFIQFILWTLVIHKSANILHDLKDKYADKYYSKSHYTGDERSKH